MNEYMNEWIIKMCSVLNDWKYENTRLPVLYCCPGFKPQTHRSPVHYVTTGPMEKWHKYRTTQQRIKRTNKLGTGTCLHKQDKSWRRFLWNKLGQSRDEARLCDSQCSKHQCNIGPKLCQSLLAEKDSHRWMRTSLDKNWSAERSLKVVSPCGCFTKWCSRIIDNNTQHPSFMSMWQTLKTSDVNITTKHRNSYILYPANTKHLYNICTMLDQRRRRWADVVQMLYKCFVLAGYGLHAMAAHFKTIIIPLILKLFFNPFYYPIKSLLLGMKWVFKHQDLHMFDLKLNKWAIFSHLKLCVAVAEILNYFIYCFKG